MSPLGIPGDDVDTMLREMASGRGGGGVWRPKLEDDGGLRKEHAEMVEECEAEWEGRRAQLGQYVEGYRRDREQVGGADVMNLTE